MNKQELQQAYELAKEARERAYAPYSKYHVGAVLVLKNGQCVAGCNVENASYGATICAERNAIFSTISTYGKCDAICLVLVTETEASPCGMCLQVLSEFFAPDFPIYISDKQKIIKKKLLSDFLPLPFAKEKLSNHGSR